MDRLDDIYLDSISVKIRQMPPSKTRVFALEDATWTKCKAEYETGNIKVVTDMEEAVEKLDRVFGK